MERNIKEIQQCLYTNPEFNAIALHQPLWSVTVEKQAQLQEKNHPWKRKGETYMEYFASKSIK